MAFNLTLRTTKGNRLTHGELDDNFLHLKGRDIVSATLVNDELILTKEDGGTINIPMSGITGSIDKYVETEAFSPSVVKTITHSLGTEDVQVQVWDGLNQVVGTIIMLTSGDESNSVDITLSVGGTYKVVIIG